MRIITVWWIKYQSQGLHKSWDLTGLLKMRAALSLPLSGLSWWSRKLFILSHPFKHKRRNPGLILLWWCPQFEAALKFSTKHIFSLRNNSWEQRTTFLPELLNNINYSLQCHTQVGPWKRSLRIEHSKLRWAPWQLQMLLTGSPRSWWHTVPATFTLCSALTQEPDQWDTRLPRPLAGVLRHMHFSLWSECLSV